MKKVLGILFVVLLSCGFGGGVSQAQKTINFTPGYYSPCDYKIHGRRCYFTFAEPSYYFESDGTGFVRKGPQATLQINDIDWKQEGKIINVIFKKSYASPLYKIGTKMIFTIQHEKIINNNDNYFGRHVSMGENEGNPFFVPF